MRRVLRAQGGFLVAEIKRQNHPTILPDDPWPMPSCTLTVEYRSMASLLEPFHQAETSANYCARQCASRKV
jgi:hypothetical protein